MTDQRQNSSGKAQALLALLTLGSVVAFLFLSLTGSRLLERYSPLVDAAMEIKYEVSRFHLWFEELVQGDSSLNPSLVWRHLDRSVWFARAMLEGGANEEGRYEPLIDQDARAAIMRTLAALDELRSVATIRMENSKSSLAGSSSDQDFDRVFGIVLAEADAVETALQVHIADEINIYNITSYVLLVLLLAGAGATAVTLRNADAQARRYVLSLEEKEEELSRAVEELSRSNAELERFAGVAAHDLLEPARTMESFGKLLTEKKGGTLDEEGRDFVQTMTEGAGRMRQLVQDLLDLSRLSKTPRAFSPVDLRDAYEAALLNLSEALKEKKAEVSCNELPKVMADPSLLIQVFQNLVANAIKFQPKGRRPLVSVQAVRKDGEWLVSIRDNGIGIDPAKADQIFAAFTRLHDRGEYPGTGLGLALCRRIVEMHGGKIWVGKESGKGAVIHFTLPALESNDDEKPDVA